MPWDGNKRRLSDSNNDIHELVIRIDENVKSIKEDHGDFKKAFEKHLDENEKDFESVHSRITPIKNTMLKISGAWMVIAFIFGLLMKFWK